MIAAATSRTIASQPRPALAEGTTVWVLHLATIDAWLTREPNLYRLLSSRERTRAELFATVKARQAYVSAHVGLRALLSSLCGSAIGLAEFDWTRTGKPLLRETDLQFNLSASGGYALVAVSQRGPVGVDIEVAKPTSVTNWTQRYPALRRFATPGGDPGLTFLRAWTRLEAWCKRRALPVGDLLDRDFEQYCSGEDLQREMAELVDLQVPHGYVAACACDPGGGIGIQSFEGGEVIEIDANHQTRNNHQTRIVTGQE